MRNNIIYNQRFNKSVNDIGAIINEFRGLINSGHTDTEDMVKIQLLKNEFNRAVKILLEEVENTKSCKITVFSEFDRTDLETVKNDTEIEIIEMDNTGLPDVDRISFINKTDKKNRFLNDLSNLIFELKRYYE